eukprot:6194932-Pleurochrysis_carterae.AAC.1
MFSPALIVATPIGPVENQRSKNTPGSGVRDSDRARPSSGGSVIHLVELPGLGKSGGPLLSIIGLTLSVWFSALVLAERKSRNKRHRRRLRSAAAAATPRAPPSTPPAIACEATSPNAVFPNPHSG